MPRLLILYYTRTGNTGKMAQAVAEGAKTAQGVEVELSYYVPAKSLESFDAIIIGTPTYHHDMPTGMKDFLEEAAVKNVVLKGKVGATFGSYGWSGEAQKMVIEIMKNKFEMNVPEPPLLAKYTPDEQALQKCRELGKGIAEKLMHTATES